MWSKRFEFIVPTSLSFQFAMQGSFRNRRVIGNEHTAYKGNITH